MNLHHIVVKTVNELGIPAEQVFKRSYEYAEVRVSKTFLVQRFLDYLHQDKVPDVVLDFCLEVLTHHHEKTIP